MNARDQLLRIIDHNLLDANEVLTDILFNILNIDTANFAAESILSDNGFDAELAEIEA